MKIKQLFFLALFCTQVFAQKRIYGKVIDENKKPLIGATIYLNSTSNWTTSDENGEFELPISGSSLKMIVSYLGYYSLLHKINLNSYGKSLVFTMNPKVNQLNEIVLKTKKKSKAKENRYMKQFLDAFLGTSSLAKSCTVLNKNVIRFKFNEHTNTLEVSATEPIKIRNNGLGYLISYDLIYFEKNPEKVYYLGHSRYENLNASKQVINKWAKNRKTAYRGSITHFLRSIIANNLKEEGFIVDVLKEVQNPKRPHDSIIQNAIVSLESLVSPSGERHIVETKKIKGNTNKKMNLHRAKNEFDFIQKKNSYLTILNKAKLPKGIRPNDSIIENTRISLQNLISPSGDRYFGEGIQKKKKLFYAKSISDYKKKKKYYTSIIKKASLPKTKNTLLKNVKPKEFTIYKNGVLNLSFKYHIYVKYTKEQEIFQGYQLSKIKLADGMAPINNSGNIINPLQVILYEHMGLEKLGDTLPLNYEIEN